MAIREITKTNNISVFALKKNKKKKPYNISVFAVVTTEQIMKLITQFS
jgi:hypothetical protein